MNFQLSIRIHVYVSNSPRSDDQFACRVESWLQQSTYLANDANASFITVDLLYDCIESLKLRKAAGHDGVTSEHIVLGVMILLCTCVYYSSPCEDIHLCLVTFDLD